MGDYKPQITVEKGIIEGTLTTVIAAVVVGLKPDADPIEVATIIGAVIAAAKMGRNWFKNRKGSKQ